MPSQTSVLCPVDFSEASRGALRYAAFVSTQLGAELVALTVEDPLLAEAHTLGSGMMWRPDETERELRAFVASAIDASSPTSPIRCRVVVGKPAPEILRVARECASDLIVISSRGATGLRKLFFGSTTERVLRETTRPVLVTPPVDPGPITLEDVTRLAQRILVPVDLSADSAQLTRAAAFLARALALPILLVHVIEPARGPFAERLHATAVDAERRARAEEALARLSGSASGVRSEALVVYGDPAEEVAKVARDRMAGLFVVGLYGSPLSGPRMGSVTYRILCLTRGLVLAIPPRVVDASTLPEVAAAAREQ